MVTTLQAISDTDLLNGLKAAVAASDQTTAAILSYLVEVEDRRLHVKAAIASLVDYCVQKLRMSEDQAQRRVDLTAVMKYMFGDGLKTLEKECFAKRTRRMHDRPRAAIDFGIAEIPLMPNAKHGDRWPADRRAPAEFVAEFRSAER